MLSSHESPDGTLELTEISDICSTNDSILSILTDNSNASQRSSALPNIVLTELELSDVTDTTGQTDEHLSENEEPTNDTGTAQTSDSLHNDKVTVLDDGTLQYQQLKMKCTHCEETFSTTHDLYTHIRSHQDHTKCPYCGKISNSMPTFVYHVRTHTGEKPYYCPIAGCDFHNAVKYNLKVHLASIRHGGRETLRKYAKILDLDVCEKSLKKRKDNSVHELGARRSKKRKRLSESSTQEDQDFEDVAAQILFNVASVPPAFDPNQFCWQLGSFPGTMIMPSNFPNIATLPPMPHLPSIPNVPNMSTIPNISTLPPIATFQSFPNIPTLQNLSNLNIGMNPNPSMLSFPFDTNYNLDLPELPHIPDLQPLTNFTTPTQTDSQTSSQKTEPSPEDDEALPPPPLMPPVLPPPPLRWEEHGIDCNKSESSNSECKLEPVQNPNQFQNPPIVFSNQYIGSAPVDSCNCTAPFTNCFNCNGNASNVMMNSNNMNDTLHNFNTFTPLSQSHNVFDNMSATTASLFRQSLKSDFMRNEYQIYQNTG